MMTPRTAWANSVQLVFFAHRYPFVFAQLMVGQQLDFFDIAHIAGGRRL
jgi:hypothetical protein